MQAVKLTEDILKQKLKAIRKDAHKGSNGTLDIIAGSEKYRGAADLCVGGALRTGIGIVRLISCEQAISLVAARHPSCTFFPVTGAPERKKAICDSKEKRFLIGCGLGMSADTATSVSDVIYTAKAAVIDADGLNAVSANPSLKEKLCGFIITPHVGEFSRLTGATVSDIKSDPITHALDFSKKHGCVTVLKDCVTVIASPEGKVFVSDCASEGLSKGGSGDVLAGLIAGFNAQDYSPLDSAVIGVTLHALASRRCAEENGIMSMLPSELEIYVKQVLRDLGY